MSESAFYLPMIFSQQYHVVEQC